MSTRKSGTLIATMIAVMVVSTTTLEAFVITIFPGSVFNADTAAMDAVLGISGFSVEDFEDVNLLPGLTIQTTNPDSGPTATLSKTYMDGSGRFFDNAWDGTHALVNTSTNDIWLTAPGVSRLDLIAEKVGFHLANAAGSFGVGLGNLQADVVDHALLVNGVVVVGALENISEFTSGINLRNGYLRIDAEGSESILSVAIELRANGTQSPVSGASGDGMIFDHVAFTPIPEPSTLGLLVLAGLLIRRSRQGTGLGRTP